MKKKGRKSRKEKKQEIDAFIKVINERYAERFNFINVKYINTQLEKFNTWGYAIGSPVLFQIDQLIKDAKKTELLFKEITKRQ